MKTDLQTVGILSRFLKPISAEYMKYKKINKKIDKTCQRLGALIKNENDINKTYVGNINKKL